MATSIPGTLRDQIAVEDRDKLIENHALCADPRRWRPRWFDGRFLAAADLQAEQNYFLIRQADIGRAGGSGVVDGLAVEEIPNPKDGVEKLRIKPGLGSTDTGELIALPVELEIEPADIPAMQRLDGAFGLQPIPNESGRNRTGLYVLALRPVEWTANPIGAYPTSLTGVRTVADGTIIEGVAACLIPYPDSKQEENWPRRRARAAREIFVEGRDYGINSGVLPLAMVALRGNVIEWVDLGLVRRETGAERPVGMDFGFGNRSLREAHLLQYQEHLAFALNANGDRGFAATAYFDALPPVGVFPADTLNADQLTQRFFPPGVQVDLAFLPEDELPAVIEESLLLPPLDLTVGIENLEGTGVLVLVPLARAEFEKRRNVLPNWDTTAPQLKPAAAAVQLRLSPRDLLLARKVTALDLQLKPVGPEEPWRQLLRDTIAGRRLLWFVRRRHLPIPANIAGTPVDATHASVGDKSEFVKIVRADADFAANLRRLEKVGGPEMTSMLKLLPKTRLIEHPELLKSIVAEAAQPGAAAPKAEAAVATFLPVLDPKLGEGLNRLKKESSEVATALKGEAVIKTGELASMDKLARDIPKEKFGEFVAELKEAVNKPKTLTDKLPELRAKFAKP